MRTRARLFPPPEKGTRVSVDNLDLSVFDQKKKKKNEDFSPTSSVRGLAHGKYRLDDVTPSSVRPIHLFFPASS